GQGRPTSTFPPTTRLLSRWVSFHSTRQPENGLYIVSGRLGFGPEFRAEKWRRVAAARQVSEVGSTNDRYRDATQRTTPFAECAAAIACDAARSEERRVGREGRCRRRHRRARQKRRRDIGRR